MSTPVIDVHEDFIEVWWDAPALDVPYQVIHDRWDYQQFGKPVRFVYVISEAMS